MKKLFLISLFVLTYSASKAQNVYQFGFLDSTKNQVIKLNEMSNAFSQGNSKLGKIINLPNGEEKLIFYSSDLEKDEQHSTTYYFNKFDKCYLCVYYSDLKDVGGSLLLLMSDNYIPLNNFTLVNKEKNIKIVYTIDLNDHNVLWKTTRFITTR